MTKQRSGPLAIVPAAAVFDARVGSAGLRALCAIATHADQSGKCWPATTTLADELGLTDRQVRTQLRNLEQYGYLETAHRPGRPSLYRIVREALDPGTLASGVDVDPGTPASGGAEHELPGTPEAELPPNRLNNKTKNNPTDGVSSTTTEFDTFWQSYPSRRPHSNPKKPALAKFEAAVKNGTPPADIIRGAQNYASYVRREQIEPKYVAMAQTWLNQERWTEYQSEMPASETAFDSDVIH